MRLDLGSETGRNTLWRHLAERYAGRPIVVGPGVLAGLAPVVGMLDRVGASRVLVLSVARGAGVAPTNVEVVEVPSPGHATMTDELRGHDRLVRSLPESVVRRIEAFDPERRALWWGTPFVTTDRPILGRPVVAGRPAAFVALEDKLLAEKVWAQLDLPRAPSRIVPVDLEAMTVAVAEVSGPSGAVCAGDTRDGLNGGGDYVRWVADDHGLESACDFFAQHCARVRVAPFLDGVPCSIHGMVVADGTAVFRPVEIAVLRRPDNHEFVYGGLATYWDPPDLDRAEMRATARRVGEYLREKYDYRGGFGIDGVLTSEGFRPTELNPRLSGGATAVTGSVDRQLFALLQAALVEGATPIDVATVESAVPAMDALRVGKPVAIAPGVRCEAALVDLDWAGRRWRRAPGRTGNRLHIGDTPTGTFAKIEPCAALRPGDRLAPLNRALMAFLDAEYGTEFGDVQAAPDLR